MNKIEEIIETKGDKFPAVVDFYQWSANYEYPSPFSYFLDLIGYSSEELEDTLGDWAKVKEKIDFLELRYFSEALAEYIENPDAVYALIKELVDLEWVD